MKKKLKALIALVLALVLVGLGVLVVWGNLSVEVNTYIITNEKIPEAFGGYRIAHVTDLHNGKIGGKNEKLIEILEKADPDIISITGDLIDSRHTRIEIALEFAEKAVKIAPCYYVTGNHEAHVPEEYEALRQGLEEIGVNVLENEAVTLQKGTDSITLLGVQDPRFDSENTSYDHEVMQEYISELSYDESTFSLLLSHRPELFDVYTEHGFNLVLCGHAHGGQVRLPYIGGVYAPGQGWFPQYDSGLYSENGTQMIVSRGVANSLFPFRINNRPEVILVELCSGNRYSY